MERRKTDSGKPGILTCDPSFTAWGWAVLEGHLVKATGVIKTAPEAKKRRIRQGDDRVRRTGEIVMALLEIIGDHKIELIISELPHGSQNAKAAIMMGVVVGILQATSVWSGIPIEWYSENDAKKTLLGRISASKKEVIDSIAQLYEVPWTGTKYIDEAVADALAIYYCAECTSPTLKFMNR